jgi:hypothetical protein
MTRATRYKRWEGGGRKIRSSHTVLLNKYNALNIGSWSSESPRAHRVTSRPPATGGVTKEAFKVERSYKSESLACSPPPAVIHFSELLSVLPGTLGYRHSRTGKYNREGAVDHIHQCTCLIRMTLSKVGQRL